MSKIHEAIERMGGLTAAGACLGVSKGVVFQWKNRDRIPAEYCPQVERFTGILCEHLNDKVDWAYLRAAADPSPPAETDRRKPATA